MPLSEIEKNFIIEEMRTKLQTMDLTSVYLLDDYERARRRVYQREQYSIPEIRDIRQARGRRYDRRRYGSNINPDAPPTRSFAHRSPYEIENREIIKDFFPHSDVRFNEFPLVLYNPLTGGRMEGDAVLVDNHLMIETHERKCHSQREVQIRDLHKKIILEYHGWDLIVLTEDMRGNVEYFLRKKWDEILEKRLNGF